MSRHGSVFPLPAESTEQATLLAGRSTFLVRVVLIAPLVCRNSGLHLVDMPPAASPRRRTAHLALGWLTHGRLLVFSRTGSLWIRCALLELLSF